MADIARYVVFKPISGGYVYRAPDAWLLGARDHYLVNEAQKTAILSVITSSSRVVLWVMGLSWLALSLAAGSILLVSAVRGGYHNPALTGAIVAIVLAFSGYVAMVVSRQVLLRRLRPVLATLPPTNERITNREARQAMAQVAPATLSPTRRRVILVACIFASGAAVVAMAAQAIDMYQTHAAITFHSLSAFLWPTVLAMCVAAMYLNVRNAPR